MHIKISEILYTWYWLAPGFYPDISQKYKMGDISKEVATKYVHIEVSEIWDTNLIMVLAGARFLSRHLSKIRNGRNKQRSGHKIFTS
jgi:hypothetical protein